MLLGMLAPLDFSLNLATLMTNLALPVAVIALVRRLPAAAAQATQAEGPADASGLAAA
jgi:hypothetical protein